MPDQVSRNKPLNYHAFLIRFWRSADHAAWQIIAKNVETGEASSFRNLDTLFEYLQHRITNHSLQEGDEAHEHIATASNPIHPNQAPMRAHGSGKSLSKQEIKENPSMKTLSLMKQHTRRIVVIVGAVAVLALLAVVGSAASGSTCYVPSGGVDNYSSIQAAVNDPGCAMINVAAGTYKENVTISRSVTINGAGASTTIVDGGGISCATPEMCTVFTINQPVAVTFKGLTIQNGYHKYGPSGGIEISATADVTVTNSTLSNNKAQDGYTGGAIRTPGGSLMISDSTFSGNRTTHGGAIYNSGATMAVLNSTFSANSATYGGAIEQGGGSLTIKNSTFIGNSGEGGALNGSNITVVNSTFNNNQAGQYEGGAIYAGGNVNVSASTFSGNGATRGGAIFVYRGPFTLKNSIIANSASGTNCGDGDTPIDGGNNLRWPSSDATCVGAYGDPKLAALANNGGATQTMALQSGSAAVDAGNCNDVTGATIATDQRGVARPQGLACDIGAFESTLSSPSPTATRTSTPTATPTPTRIASSSLVAYWKFDDNGTGAFDSSGNGHTAYLDNGATLTSVGLAPLKFTNPLALTLVGSSHQFVDAGSSINMAYVTFTVAAWAKRSTTSGKQWIVGYGTNSRDKALVLGFRDNDHFTCAFFDDDLDTASTYTDTNVWHHWVCTYAGAGAIRKIYRDGVEVASDLPNSPIKASGVLNIGRVPWNQGYFNGEIDDVRIYNRVLSPAEIQSLAAGNP